MRFVARFALFALWFWVGLCVPSHAKPFRGDRWQVVQAGTTAVDVTRTMRHPAPLARRSYKRKWKKFHRHERAKVAARSGAVIVPVPRVRHEPDMDEDQAAAYRTIAGLLAGGKVYVRPAALPATHAPAKRQTLLGGLAREIGAAFGMPHRFVRGRLICAVNIGSALAERGIKGTGSKVAKSYLHWGRKSGPVPGAVAVFNRGRHGGHVALVHKVKRDGTVIYLNPSASKQRWVIGPYRKRPIGYRIAA